MAFPWKSCRQVKFQTKHAVSKSVDLSLGTPSHGASPLGDVEPSRVIRQNMAFRNVWFVCCVAVVFAVAAASQDHNGNADQDLHHEDKKSNKLSDESVMFGNQQNKPTAGMIDDALAKSFHQESDDEKRAVDDDDVPFHEDKRSPTVISEGGIEDDEASREQNDLPDDLPSRDPFRTFDDRMAQYMEHADAMPEDLRSRLEDQDIWDAVNDGVAMGRVRRNIKHRERNIRSSIDQLLAKNNGRTKRGLGSFQDEMMGMKQVKKQVPSYVNENSAWAEDDLDDAFENPDLESLFEGDGRMARRNVPSEWYEMMEKAQVPPELDLLQHGFQPPYDPYRSAEDDLNPGPAAWDAYEDHFFKRRLQESDEDENLESDEDVPPNMLPGTNLDDIYQRLIW